MDIKDKLGLEVYCESIKDIFGIKLQWSEKIALAEYIESFTSNSFQGINHYTEAIYWFMKDYFDLDVYNLGKIKVLKHAYDKEWWDLFEIDGRFLRTPEFKKFCRERVDMWRDEKTLC